MESPMNAFKPTHSKQNPTTTILKTTQNRPILLPQTNTNGVERSTEAIDGKSWQGLY